MRLVWLALSALLVSACSDMWHVTVFNETSQPLVLRLTDLPKAPGGPRASHDVVLKPGRHHRVEHYEMGHDLIIRAGPCQYNYGQEASDLWRQRKGLYASAVVVQIEPDFVAHLLAWNHTRSVVGRFRDEEVPGFPIVPVKTCGQTGLNTSAPSQAAASARL